MLAPQPRPYTAGPYYSVENYFEDPLNSEYTMFQSAPLVQPDPEQELPSVCFYQQLRLMQGAAGLQTTDFYDNCSKSGRIPNEMKYEP